MGTDAVDSARAGLGELVKPGVVTDHDQSSAAAQKITEQRFAHFAGGGKVYPEVYPPPPAGDGRDVFKAADEGGEGKCTRKELAKYLMRNQTLKYRLGAGWEKFNANFGTEDCAENHEELDAEQFVVLWAEAAELRKAAEKVAGKEAKKAEKAAGADAKKMKAVLKEGGKKGQDLAGMGEMGTLFQQAMLAEPEGDLAKVEAALVAMNKPVDPDGEERRGGAGFVAKILISAGETAMAVIVDVPEMFTKADAEGNTRGYEISACDWLDAALANLPGDGKGAVMVLRTPTLAKCTYTNDPETGRFVLKAKDAVSGASFGFLRSKSLVIDDDDSDEMIFGDDDMPGY